DGDLPVAGQVQVGVMILGLGDVAEAAEEIEGGGEVLDAPLAADVFAVVAEVPLRQDGEAVAHLRGVERLDDAFAGDTVPVGQVGNGDGHGATLPTGED